MKLEEPIKARKRPIKLRKFSKKERIEIIMDLLTSGMTKDAIWKKHTGDNRESGRILRWMRETEMDDLNTINFGLLNPAQMPEPESKSQTKSLLISELDENFQLKQKIAELENSLINSELRASAYQTAIEIAEKELKISILKKSNTKPSIK